MRTMKFPWFVLTALLLLLQTCKGAKSCHIWSTAGNEVQITSTFRVYCAFNLECTPSMYSASGHSAPRPQTHQKHNSTTIYLDVVNVTEDCTFSCDCKGSNRNTGNKLDSCGLDIFAGFPPDRPTNVSCVYHISETSSAVVCSWASGRNTFIINDTKLRVRTFTHNATGELGSFVFPAKGSPTVRANFTVDGSVQVISVRANVTNKLGSAETPEVKYILRDIMMPPAPELHEVDCFSRNCSIKIKQSVPTHHLDINYKEENKEQWTPHPKSVLTNGSVLVQSLQPYRWYSFRARSRLTTGLWSDWSRTVSKWTQEEAPGCALDVWYAVDHNKIRVYWKKLDTSVAQGKILDYIITVYDRNYNIISTQTANSNNQSHLVQLCLNCHVTVSARNSRGRSPPGNITIHTVKAKATLVPVINNKNVAISWTQHVTAPLPLEYVVEWFAKYQKPKALRWLRMGQNSSHVVITDMEPFVCYEGAVYVFYSDNSVDRLEFTDINTDVSVPTSGPVVIEKVVGTTVNVTWLSMEEPGGCIIKYIIYLEKNNRFFASYNVSPSQRFWVLRDLTPADYRIWMSISTAKGEGPPGQKVNFFIQQDPPLALIITFSVLITLVGVLICVYQFSAVKERIWVYFQYCMPDIPDPANSKWAKDCLKEKAKVNLHHQISISTVSETEEDLVLVDIQELPRPPLLPQISLSSDSETATQPYPHITYIKCFSHDSDSSGQTHTSSLGTNETVDYISPHDTAGMSEEEEEDLPTFFPSHSFFPEQLDLGPKLTLDAVKIDGSDFFLQ
ncbi:interleukin-12 receptor subunit beta-2 [Boleophthalmus pectinirostris]|uniref:interleukin-12 receptor subunit beta-2 n=1 Tax=Boleophthalmus pectinirostris TaxID=150288 RepID=UPI000A1C3C5B|nr:interleukin-12 receptor subunit beta-2 [Boleophthalmus pectinirostris]